MHKTMRHAITMMPSGELADLHVLQDLAHLAEAYGWDGFFIWDHLLRPAQEPADIADPTVALTAIALATTTIKFGPMVTPLVRRRPHKLAREAMTLDRLSGGRLILGLGLGVDFVGELSKFGELTDAVQRGDLLDEGTDLLARLLSSEHVEHHGTYFQADGVQLLPAGVQLPRVPIWMASHGERPRPIRRSGRYEGLYVLDVDPVAVRRIATVIERQRGSLDGFDIAISGTAGTDLAAMSDAGATWAVWEVRPGDSLSTVRSRIMDRESARN